MHDAHTATIEVLLDGSPLPPPMKDVLMGGSVEHQRNAPSMALLTFHDTSMQILDDRRLTPGNEIEVKTGGTSDAPDQRPATSIFKGEVVAIELDATGGDMVRTCIRAYDPSHRLHRARRSRTFLNQRDGDIVKAVAGDHGLRARVDSGTNRREWQCQHDQTDWEFILQLARENGFEVGMVDDTFAFAKQGTLGTGSPVTLTHGVELHALRLRVSAAEQSSPIKVRGWDPTQNKAVAKTAATPASEHSPEGLDVATVAARFRLRENLDTNHAATDLAVAERRATAVATHELSTVVEAEGEGLGNPLLRPGGRIKLKELGRRFSGTYMLSSVTHQFAPDSFTTRFTITGGHDRSLWGLTSPGSLRRSGHRSTGTTTPVMATVTNINDPKALGRVKLRLGWLGDEVESDWAPVVTAGAGATRGLQVLPEVDDEVMVVFAHDDVRRPMVVGGVWNSKAAMPEKESIKGGEVVKRVWQSRTGHVVTLDDTKGSEQVKVVTQDRTSLTLGAGSKSQAELTTGKATITLSPQGDVTITAAKDLTLKATGKVAIEGTAGVSVTSKANMDVAGTMTTVKGDATATLQGALVKIN